MKKTRRASSVLRIAAALLAVLLTVGAYGVLLNRTVTNNMMNSIRELAEHDQRSIESFVEAAWNELDRMALRLAAYDCGTLHEAQTRMNRERALSDFTYTYLLAEDGRVFTDKYVVYDPERSGAGPQVDLLPYFSDGEERVVTRWDDNAAEVGMTREYVLYGVRLENFSVEGVPMLALIGLSETSDIQDNIILDSFVRDGARRGYSAVISLSGNFIIGMQKTLYVNEASNLFDILDSGSRCELTNEEIRDRIQNKEVFGFHYTDREGVRKLLYFIPFEGDIQWYFMLAVENEVFAEQSQAFAAMGVGLVAIVLLLLSLLAAARSRTMRAVARAQAQSEFLSSMSHEIRTPLNGLIGLNHLIQTHIDNPGDRERIKDWLRKSHSTANYLLSLVNDILDLSKLRAGKVDIICEPLRLETLTDEVWAMQRDVIEGRGVRFRVEHALVCPHVMADGTHIKQILMNIVGNAAKFTPADGQITLTVSQTPLDGSHVETTFRCRDTGVGMSREFAAHIFDAFSQERNRASSGTKGTGLGMAISKLLTDAMDGTITVESEPDRGSTFTVTLPLEIVPEEMERRLERAAAEDGDLEGRGPVKILIAEDNALNAEILLEILGEEGFETAHAENGQRAVELFKASAPGEFDIILMDMQMPVMDGCAAAKAIRRMHRPDAKTVVIFACTANTFKEDRDRAIESGMNDFLTKPVDIHSLLQKLGARGVGDQAGGLRPARPCAGEPEGGAK